MIFGFLRSGGARIIAYTQRTQRSGCYITYTTQNTQHSKHRHRRLRMQKKHGCAALERPAPTVSPCAVAELTAARSRSRWRTRDRPGGGDGGGRGGGRRARIDEGALNPAGASCPSAPVCASRRPVTASSAAWYFGGADKRGTLGARPRSRRAGHETAQRRSEACRASHAGGDALTVLGSMRRCSTAGSKTCRAGPWRCVSARELGGCKGSRARHVEMRERPHRHKTSSLIVS